MAGRSTSMLHLLLTLLISSMGISGPSTVCLNHLGCYQDHHLHLDDVTTYYSHETKRNAENCARLCLQRRPDSEVVLVKLESVDELLACGCGYYQALGNHTGMIFDHLACYMCPDSLSEKCGSEKTSSAYEIVRYSEDPCRTVMDIPPPVTTTTTTAAPTTTMEDLPAPEETFTLTNTSNITIYSPPYSSPNSSAVTTTLKNFRHLGCYDEDNLNQTLVVTVVVDNGDNGVKSCADGCKAEHPAAEVFLIKVLDDFNLYCGCGLPSVLAMSDGQNSSQCGMTCSSGRAAVPCGGWTAVSAYERSSGSAVASSSCLMAVSIIFIAKTLNRY